MNKLHLSFMQVLHNILEHYKRTHWCQSVHFKGTHEEDGLRPLVNRLIVHNGV